MDVQSSYSQSTLLYQKKSCAFSMSARLPLKPHIPVACVQIPTPFRKNQIFPEGRVVCTQANIPVTVWFIETKNERKEERRNFRSI